MRVLVVEDDAALGQFLQKGLTLQGHEVEWATDGESGLERAVEFAPDLMVLDLGLPSCDGTAVLDEMQSRCPGTTVLILTGRSEMEERVACLNRGADDFMLKPFSFHEMVARCHALLRRRERFADPVLRFGTLAMDRIQRKVLYGGAEVELTGKEYALLEALLRRRGACCSRMDLLEEVWNGTTEGGTNIVDVYVTYLRRKLAAVQSQGEFKDGFKDRIVGSAIETVRGSGYRLRVERRVEQGPAVGRRASDVPMQLAQSA